MATPPLHHGSPSSEESPPTVDSYIGRHETRLRLDELIPRPALRIDRDGLRHYLTGRTVLVTGAGGSIGTELTHQLISLRPARLVLVDVSEHNLFALEQAFGDATRGNDLAFRLVDVRDAQAMEHLFDAFRPDVVLHAAAYKHVPLMERHPAAAFQNNTMATARLLAQCDIHGVDQFVLVSTDKAVEPASVLGATKRLAEWHVRSATTDVTRKIVRFGNVFGTRGSVVPRFEQQLARGGPLTVTHPEMERYFMSAGEACGLILQTLLLDAAPVYALQMGAPVRIRWLAEQVVRHLAPERDPDDLIVYTGRRPGEKLREVLHAPSETTHPTDHPRILGMNGPLPATPEALAAHLDHLAQLAIDGASESLHDALHAADLRAPDTVQTAFR